MTKQEESNIVETWDISGFPHGYEQVCQQALWLGIQWLSKQDNSYDIFKGTGSFNNVFGLIETPESCKELESIWSDWDNRVWKGWSGAQHHAVVNHLRFIAKNGLQKWRQEIKENRPQDKPMRFDIEKMELLN